MSEQPNSSSAKENRPSRAAARPSDDAERPAKAPLTASRPELLVDGSDRDFRRLVHGLLPFLALHTDIRDGYAELLGLQGPQYTILLCIRTLGYSGTVNVRTIADHLRLSGSFITAETNTLERLGLVTKRRGLEDRRLVSVALTPKGAALLDSIADLRRQVNDVQFGCLTKEEFQLLVPIVERLVQSGERALALLKFMKEHGTGAWQPAKAETADGAAGR